MRGEIFSSWRIHVVILWLLVMVSPRDEHFLVLVALLLMIAGVFLVPPLSSWPLPLQLPALDHVYPANDSVRAQWEDGVVVILYFGMVGISYVPRSPQSPQGGTS